MARMTRILITVDQETLKNLSLWKRNKSYPASLIIRESLAAYTRWRAKDLQPTPGSFDGVDAEIVYD